ncbi:hypothetical protein TRFO_12391 [Tritrichomonas foetus]|uniref:Aminoglycoside phosphotransferase domain-containing protein n=1 Tax=Tritrichomonas foetus TaxID=1144522 RepID=A0A1J4L1N0_9EUKA|nr:hypothetical protein TRFO_12391 [Tritrichomonas foetus]|eukprot:OHT17431.1 hypothetical protein TRFO_12391 [Tritrichomonas foetus]
MECRYYFKELINGWESWENLIKSSNIFEDLVRHIFSQNGLKFTKIDQAFPAWNAVFKVGTFLIKIFAPIESGYKYSLSDFNTEIKGQKFALSAGVNTPKIISHGVFNDKYEFLYLIEEFIENCVTLEDDFFFSLCEEEKRSIGKKLREIVDKMNVKNESIRSMNFFEMFQRNENWMKFPLSFHQEQHKKVQEFQKKIDNSHNCNYTNNNYINSSNYQINNNQTNDYGINKNDGNKKNEELGVLDIDLVFVHGDLHGGNILYSKDTRTLTIIDFADSFQAPKSYEHSLIAMELFRFDKSAILGFFSEEEISNLPEICFESTLIHDLGEETIRDLFGSIEQFTSISIFKEKLVELFRKNVLE